MCHNWWIDVLPTKVQIRFISGGQTSQAVQQRWTVVTAIQKYIGKWQFRPIVELQLLKISFWNLAHMITSPHMQILGQILYTGQTTATVHTLSGWNDVFPCKDVLFGG